MRRWVMAMICVTLVVWGSGPVLAAPPTIVNYQGLVKQSGVPYNGTGYFRFAIVNPAGTVTYWSNDGSSAAGSAPTQSVPITVWDGIYSVGLGDTNLPGMTQVLPSTVFDTSNRNLRVWFDNDAFPPFEQLSPDRPITSVAYALQAEKAVDATTVAGQTVTAIAVPSGGMILGLPYDTALTTAGYTNLGTTNITYDGIWRVLQPTGAPTARDDHSYAWTNSYLVVWGGNLGAARTNTGGRYTLSTDTWTATSTVGAPSARQGAEAVWTSGYLCIWGGHDGMTFYQDGGRYTPVGNTWNGITATGAPAARTDHTAVYATSNNYMIVFGGIDAGSTLLNTGGRYFPPSDTWSTMTTIGAPSARFLHSAVWAGSQMIVWGGQTTGWIPVNTGGRYQPSDSWTAMSTVNAPTARDSHCSVWTGTEMIIWGGKISGGTAQANGALYNPVTDTWRSMSTLNGPAARYDATAVWTGNEMLVWGGRDSSSYLNSGGRYNPETDTWSAFPTTGAPTGRHYHAAVWSGAEMLIWGGSGSGGLVNNGGRFDVLLQVYQKP